MLIMTNERQPLGGYYGPDDPRGMCSAGLFAQAPESERGAYQPRVVQGLGGAAVTSVCGQAVLLEPPAAPWRGR
jgi:hypothetical protein